MITIDHIIRILAIMEAIVSNLANDLANHRPVIAMNLAHLRFNNYCSCVNDLINTLSGDDKRVAMDLASSVIHAFNEEVYFASLIFEVPDGSWFFVDQKDDSVFWSYNMDEVDNESDWAKKPTQMKRMTIDLRKEIILHGLDALN